MLILSFLGPLGIPELVILGLVVLVLFSGRIPALAKALVGGVNEFRKGLAGEEDAAPSAGAAAPKLPGGKLSDRDPS